MKTNKRFIIKDSAQYLYETVFYTIYYVIRFCIANRRIVYMHQYKYRIKNSYAHIKSKPVQQMNFILCKICKKLNDK